MNLQRSYVIFVRYMYLLFGNAQRLVPIFIWVVLDVVMWGFLTKYLNSIGNAGFSFVPLLLGAIILSDFLSRVQQGVSMPFLEDVWSRNLINFFASPLRVEEYLLGLIAASVVTSALGLTLMILVALAVFGFSLLQFGATLIAMLGILFLFGIALGIFGVSVVLRLGPSGEWYIWPLVTVLTPFIGVFYPVTVLPQWMQLVSKILPPSYVFEAARGIVTGTVVSDTDLLFGFILALLYIAAAYFFFLFVYKSATKTGAMTRYYAENSE